MNFMNYILVFIVYCTSTLWAFDSDDIHTEVDLSWPFDNNTFTWRNSGPFSVSKKIEGSETYGYWSAKHDFCVGEHAGTHFDAPYHFNEQGWKVGDVPLFKLIANGITIDLTEETALLKHEARLLPKHILQWERNHGKMPNNCVILVKFGWSQYYKNHNQYLGLDENNVARFPGISKEAAELIADLETVVGVGIDTASLEPGNTTGHAVHRALTKKQIYILENLNIPSDFPETNFKLYVMPMNIKEGTGAPLRLVAQPKRVRDFAMSSSNLPCFNWLTIVAGLMTPLFKKFVF